VADHPYFGDKLDAYALTGFLLGQTERITGMVTVTNLPSRPAPVLARTLTSLSVLSGGRITSEPLAATRGEDGRWIGGSVRQWVDELTTAVLDRSGRRRAPRSPLCASVHDASLHPCRGDSLGEHRVSEPPVPQPLVRDIGT
jgi:hypothetical protein